MSANDKLKRLLDELQAEVDSGGEERREELAQWFGGVLEHERRKNERTVSLTEMLRQGHGLEDSSADDSEAPPAA